MRTFFEENQIDAIKFSEEIKLVGCLIFNLHYDSHKGDSMPSEGKTLFLLDTIKKASRKGIEAKSDSERINKMIAWSSRSVLKQL